MSNYIPTDGPAFSKTNRIQVLFAKVVYVLIITVCMFQYVISYKNV